MTYAQFSKVEALDYNTFANAAANINVIWGNTNSGNTGYGQSNIANVSTTDKITSQQWTDLIDDLNKITNHQTGANTTIANTQATTANLIHILSNATLTNTSSVLTDAITFIQQRPGNAASQGSSSATTGSNNTSWRDLLVFQIDVGFADYDHARWFFNAGGQLAVSVNHGASGGINDIIAGLCNNMGTIWLSYPNSGTVNLAGTNWTGVQQVGGGGGTVNTNNGFYSLGTQTLYNGTSGSGAFGGRYASSSLTLTATVTGGTVRFTLTIDEVWTGGVGPQVGISVGTPTTVTATVRQPETTNLTNNWGSPTPSITITNRS